MPGPTTADVEWGRVTCDAEDRPHHVCGWTGDVAITWDADAQVWWWDCPRCGFSHESDGY